jgi:toxin ParE1/3/4
MPDRYRILLSKRAAAELQAIFDYIAQDSPQNASGMVARILDAIDKLRMFPHRTVVEKQNPRLKHPVRSLPVQSHIVFFRVIDEQHVVRILRVRHGAMKRPR